MKKMVKLNTWPYHSFVDLDPVHEYLNRPSPGPVILSKEDQDKLNNYWKKVRENPEFGRGKR